MRGSADEGSLDKNYGESVIEKRVQACSDAAIHALPGMPSPRSSAHVTRVGPIIPVTARPLRGSRAGLQGASVNMSCCR